MDANRFDALSRTFASPSSRRAAVRTLGVGGLLAALFGRPVRALAQETTCELQVELVPAENSNARELRGTITLVIDEEGAIDDGFFETEDGDEFDVVGQATGRAISLFIDLDGDPLALTGVGERDVVLCRGTFAGTYGGPVPGDLGSWTAGKQRTSTGGDEGNGGGSSGGGETSGGGGGNTGGGGGNSGGGGGDNGSGSSGGGNCPSGVVCGGVCCTPRVGFTPDDIFCDNGFCACTYSCASAGCDAGGTENSFTMGCDARPDARCHNECNFPTDNGCGDMSCNDGEELDIDSCTCFPIDGGGSSGGELDPDEDQDGDGLSNGTEAVLGTLPDAWDTDGDTLNDGEEINSTGTDPLSRDSDGDLHPDNEEVVVGTDPWDPNSHL